MQINSLDSIKGRKVLKEIYFNLKYKRFFKGIKLLYILWKICIKNENISEYSNSEIEIAHSLGFFRGTAIWMEEIFNRYYFSSLNAFVYFGAAVLLILVGLRRFSDVVNDGIVIFGFILEASMLVLMFIFMLFSPPEDNAEEIEEKENSAQDELISEIGEIARDFANATLHLEKISANLNQIQENQINVFTTLNDVSKNFLKAATPNDEMLISMKEINNSLGSFQKNIEFLNTELHKIQLNQIEQAIQTELGKIISSKLYNAE